MRLAGVIMNEMKLLIKGNKQMSVDSQGNILIFCVTAWERAFFADFARPYFPKVKGKRENSLLSVAYSTIRNLFLVGH